MQLYKEKQQDVVAAESCSFAGIAELFDELANEERHRRASFEERMEKVFRELRASVEEDLARAACEARRNLTDARREATEARKLAQPCGVFFSSLEKEEVPANLAQALKREVQTSTRAEAERLAQHLRQELADALAAACQDHAEKLTKESDKWAEACAGQMADLMSSEKQARNQGLTEADERLRRFEERQELQNQEICNSAEAACRLVTAEVETRIGALFAQLQDAHTTLQSVLDRYAERWERAWREEIASEARARQEADNKLLMRLSDMQKELLMESDVRSSADSQVVAGLENLRTLLAQVVNLMQAAPVARSSAVSTRSSCNTIIENDKATLDALVETLAEDVKILSVSTKAPICNVLQATSSPLVQRLPASPQASVAPLTAFRSPSPQVFRSSRAIVRA
mmetsp:Transcript_85499/g.134416  ORF Transcript_85499/g.134416 Transcript_85499/m.134416 type:complete len:402 (+) Transcript_85499:63-1268(+)